MRLRIWWLAPRTSARAGSSLRDGYRISTGTRVPVIGSALMERIMPTAKQPSQPPRGSKSPHPSQRYRTPRERRKPFVAVLNEVRGLSALRLLHRARLASALVAAAVRRGAHATRPSGALRTLSLALSGLARTAAGTWRDRLNGLHDCAQAAEDCSVPTATGASASSAVIGKRTDALDASYRALLREISRALGAINRAAHEAPVGSSSRRYWFQVKDDILSALIIGVPCSVDVSWQYQPARRKWLLLVNVGFVKSFHIPFKSLSSPAQSCVLGLIGEAPRRAG